MLLTDAIQRARKLLVLYQRPYVVFKRNGRIGVIPLGTFYDLPGNDAKRIYTATYNAKGEII